MLRALACTLFVFSAFAQEAKIEKIPSDKAPAGVDEALRKRVSHFYQAHVDAKFRVADQVVAEDSKEIFFAAPKPKYEGFEIVRTNYWDNFTKAEAVVACKAFWNIQGENMPVTMPITTTWKLENGDWYWYWRAPEKVETPFGTMNFNSGVPRDPNTPAAPVMPANPVKMKEQILSMIQVDKSEIMLSSYEPASAEVKIKNGMPGPISLRTDVDGAFAGFTAKLDKTDLKGGDTAILKIVCEPKDRAPKPTLIVRIYVEPTNQIFPVKLTFAVPPEIEKLLPKQPKQP